MFTVVMQELEHLQTVDHKFMISGHSHLECDYDHSVIERKRNVQTVYIPPT